MGEGLQVRLRRPINEDVVSCFHWVVGGYYFVWGESVFPGALADGGPTHHPLPEGGGGSEGGLGDL